METNKNTKIYNMDLCFLGLKNKKSFFHSNLPTLLHTVMCLVIL